MPLIGYSRAVDQCNLEYPYNSSDSYVQEYLRNFLEKEAAPGIEVERKLIKETLPKIDLTRLNAMITQLINDENRDRDVLITGADDARGTFPDEVDIDRWMKEVARETLAPNQEEELSKKLLSVRPVPGMIVKTERDQQLNTIMYQLSNGIKVLVKPTDFKNDEILFSSFGTGGTANYPDADFMSATNATAIISASGLGNFNVSELSRFLAGKQLSARNVISDKYHGIGGSATQGDLETAFQLMYALYTRPRLDSTAFKNFISRSKAGLQNRDKDPNSVFGDTVNAVLGNHHFRRTGPSIAKLDMIDPGRSLAIYKELFGDLSSTTFVFTGNVDTAALKPLLLNYLAALPNVSKPVAYSKLDMPLPKGEISKNVLMGSEPKASVLFVFHGGLPATAKEKQRLKAYKEVLAIRLIERLREEESGVYSPSVSAGITTKPEGRYTLFIQFGCAPQNVDKLVASTLDEMARIKREGPLPVNIEKWKAETNRQTELQLKSNKWWIDYLCTKLQNGEDLHEYQQYPELTGSVTVAGEKEFADKYLTGKNYIKLVLLPNNAK